MRFIVKHHQLSGEWLVFDVGEDLELVGVFTSKAEATEQASRLEAAFERRQRWAREPALKAA